VPSFYLQPQKLRRCVLRTDIRDLTNEALYV
jgi:hypothetical protein